MYQEGQHIEQIRAAAEAGDSKAAFDLGWCYYIGNGVAQDKSKAWHWYKEAASHGVREAAEILAVLEAEARRASELESLIPREKEAALHGHRTRWVIVIVLVVACLGSIGILVHVLGADSTIIDREKGIQDDEAMTADAEPVRAADNRGATVGEGAVVRPEGFAPPPVGAPDNTVSQEKAAAIQGGRADPNADSLIAKSPDPEPEGILVGIARIAEKWLGEPNDPNNSS